MTKIRIKLIALLIIMSAAVISLCGCSEDAYVSVRIDGYDVAVHQVEVETDSFLDDTSDTSHEDTEVLIFSPLLQEEDIPSAAVGDILEITIGGDFDSAYLYDHLLNDNGVSIYSDSEAALQLGDVNKITLSHHSAELSSLLPSTAYSEHIRGFRLVIYRGGVPEEYAFVVYLSENG